MCINAGLAQRRVTIANMRHLHRQIASGVRFPQHMPPVESHTSTLHQPPARRSETRRERPTAHNPHKIRFRATRSPFRQSTMHNRGTTERGIPPLKALLRQ